MEQLLRDGLTSLGLPGEGVPALLRYADMLVETNKVMNLTAITEPADIAALHFLDSAALDPGGFPEQVGGGRRHRRRLSRHASAHSGALHSSDAAGLPK